MKTIHYLRLIRPGNVITSVADILAGIAISGFYLLHPLSVAWLPVFSLCLSSACLYSGGIVFNDVFDAALDKIERPERPIPSGIIGQNQAALTGSLLLLVGIICAATVNIVATMIALLIAILALTYNKFSKHYTYLGPLNMGVCRGLNLLLGISIISSSLGKWYFLSTIAVTYIFSITLISQGEVHGGGKTKLLSATFLYLIVAGAIITQAASNRQLPETALLIVPFLISVLIPLLKAIRQPKAANIGKAVKAGVISLIWMDAAWAACFNSFLAALFIVCLLPVSLWLAKRFAVT